MPTIPERALRAGLIGALVASLAITGCTAARSASRDAPATSPRLYQHQGGYVPYRVDHYFGSGGP
jgi:hypothetical protein